MHAAECDAGVANGNNSVSMSYFSPLGQFLLWEFKETEGASFTKSAVLI